MNDSSHTFSPDGVSITGVTFESLAALIREWNKKPVLKEIRCDWYAYWKLWRFMAELREENNKAAGWPDPPPVNIYSGVPLRIHEDCKPGQWKAIDTQGNVMAEGNLLPDELPPEPAAAPAASTAASGRSTPSSPPGTPSAVVLPGPPPWPS